MIKAHQAIKCVNLVRASLPMDTGNLRFNGVSYGYTKNYLEINVGGYRAPYFEFLQDKKFFENQYGISKVENPYYNNFTDKTFAPVFNYLKFALNGEFGGGRFLIQKTMSARQAQTIVERTQNVNLLQRAEVYYNYMGGR
jgi:hypothetical protein